MPKINFPKLRKYAIVIGMGCLGLSIIAVAALTLFFKQTREPLKLFDPKDTPVFDVVRTGGNNHEKVMLPLSIPNFVPKLRAHQIFIDHKAILDAKADIAEDFPIYLKATHRFDTSNTFSLNTNDFNVGMECDGNPYDVNNRPKLTLENGKLVSKMRFTIEQKQPFTTYRPNYKLESVCDYELVDSKGVGIGGSASTIKNPIVLTN